MKMAPKRMPQMEPSREKGWALMMSDAEEIHQQARIAEDTRFTASERAAAKRRAEAALRRMLKKHG